MGYLLIFGTILFTVYGQIIIKWQVTNAGDFPVDLTGKLWFLLRLAINPWVISSLCGAFLAFICWMAAMTKFDLSYAYPFVSLSFVMVLILSSIFFHDYGLPLYHAPGSWARGKRVVAVKGVIGRIVGKGNGIIGGKNCIDLSIFQNPDPTVPVVAVFAHDSACLLQESFQVCRRQQETVYLRNGLHNLPQIELAVEEDVDFLGSLFNF